MPFDRIPSDKDRSKKQEMEVLSDQVACRCLPARSEGKPEKRGPEKQPN